MYILQYAAPFFPKNKLDAIQVLPSPPLTASHYDEVELHVSTCFAQIPWRRISVSQA